MDFLFELPAINIRLPFFTLIQMPAEDVQGVCWWLFRDFIQVHVGLFHFVTAFVMIAAWTGSDHIRPLVLPAHVAWDDVVHCHSAITLPAVLAGIIVATKYLTTRQLDAWPRTVDLHFQPNNRGARDQLRYSFYVTASVHDHVGFARQEQSNRTACGTDIDRFEICV